MIKLVGLLRKKEGLSREAFIDYYENHHAPLACRLLPMGHDYRRSYTEKMRVNGREVSDAFEYDVVSELWFEDEAAYRAFAATMSRPDIFSQIVADEEKFLDRSANKILIVDERRTIP